MQADRQTYKRIHTHAGEEAHPGQVTQKLDFSLDSAALERSLYLFGCSFLTA